MTEQFHFRGRDFTSVDIWDHLRATVPPASPAVCHHSSSLWQCSGHPWESREGLCCWVQIVSNGLICFKDMLLIVFLVYVLLIKSLSVQGSTVQFRHVRIHFIIIYVLRTLKNYDKVKIKRIYYIRYWSTLVAYSNRYVCNNYSLMSQFLGLIHHVGGGHHT